MIRTYCQSIKVIKKTAYKKEKRIQMEIIANPKPIRHTVYPILILMGICHLLNDTLQSVVPAMFPILEKNMGLTYLQLGMIAFSLNMVSSVMQPIIGWYTDKKPIPYALPLGLSASMVGIFVLGFSNSYIIIILSVIFIGLGSAIFHPEGSRVAFLAAGDKRGLAQSIYQVGGNTGQALAPLIAALIIIPLGQIGASWFTIVAAIAVVFLIYVAGWYKKALVQFQLNKTKKQDYKPLTTKRMAWFSLVLIIFLIFARSWYISAITNFYAFYAINTYGINITTAQLYTFTFLGAGAIGTFAGGPLADRFGRKNVIVLSLLGSVPFTIALPFVQSYLALILLFIAGVILMLSFSVMVVYAQELFPGRVGTMAGLTVGLAFGMGAIGSVLLGYMADTIGLKDTIIFVSFLPVLGLISLLLPSDPS